MSLSPASARVQDAMTALFEAVSAVERENRELHARNVELVSQNLEQADDIHALQSAARVAGLEAGARQALLMARRYIDEGDSLDTDRVRMCITRALAAVAQIESAA